jgi:hypothetical protein
MSYRDNINVFSLDFVLIILLYHLNKVLVNESRKSNRCK